VPAAAGRAWSGPQARWESASSRSQSEVSEPPGEEPVPLAERSHWGKKIAAGEFVTSVEIMPAKGWVATPMIQQSHQIKQAGIDAVSLLDGSRAQSRMGAVPSAMIIEREVRIETVFHYCCRDRNMMRMVSDLVGAAAAGLRNILIITGDPPTM
jgi:homocysteine S-methyltransferase